MVKICRFLVPRRTLSKDGPKITLSLGKQTEARNGKKRDQLDTTFNNFEAAFKSKTTLEIIRAYFVYTLCSVNYLVENNMTLMRTARKTLGKNIFIGLMKMTFYGHFVGGEDRERVMATLGRLHSFGVRSILDYSVEEDLTRDEAEKREMDSTHSELENTSFDSREEVTVGGEMPQYHADKKFADRRQGVDSARTYFYLDEQLCDKNLNVFLEGIDLVSQMDKEGTGFAAIKLTALGRPQLLLQLSEVIMRAREFAHNIMGGETENVIKKHLTAEEIAKRLEAAGIKDVASFMNNVVTDREGVIHLFPWTGIVDQNLELSKTFRVPKEEGMVRLISQLSEREEEMFRNMLRRLNTLLTEARKKDVRILVDAEQTYFQPAISRITLEMMNKYNLEKAIVCNTYQCYLKNALKELTSDLEQATRQKFHFGCKLVRGAYIDQERARAASLGYPDPINPNYDATTDMYHDTFLECLRQIQEARRKQSPTSFKIMVATHNEDTVRFAVDKMREFDVDPADRTVCFGQLYGMSDNITFPMGQAGFSVYKYLPYGPVEEVLPYLSRRAHENKGILKKVKKEKSMLLSELRRRIFKGQIFHKPKGDYTPAPNQAATDEIRAGMTNE